MTDQTAPQSGAELLARIRPRLREETTQVCLRPDLIEAWQEANEALVEQQATDMASPRLGSPGTSKSALALADEVARLESEIDATAITFKFRAMTKDAWQRLCAEHGPRRGDQVDAMVGYNRDAVLDAAVRLSMIDPEFDDESWDDFLDVINPNEWAELRETVNSVNRSVTDSPKSPLASRIRSQRGLASAPPETGMSAPESSTGGSRKKSTKRSTPTTT